MVVVGVLALQGGFDAHIEALKKIGEITISKVTCAKELEKIEALIIPGGESSTFLKLLTEELKQELLRKINSGMPVFGTCAGLILLAKNVENPPQESLAVLDIDVKRNAYGRQLDSFETEELVWEKDKSKANFNAIFIRAPKITRVGTNVDVLMRLKGEPVLVKSGNILGACFHPELNQSELTIHKLFIGAIK